MIPTSCDTDFQAFIFMVFVSEDLLLLYTAV